MSSFRLVVRQLADVEPVVRLILLLGTLEAALAPTAERGRRWLASRLVAALAHDEVNDVEVVELAQELHSQQRRRAAVVWCQSLHGHEEPRRRERAAAS